MAVGNTIQIDTDHGDFKREEANGTGVLNPGNLLELAADASVQAHSTEGGFGILAVAVEDALQGKTVSDAYANGAKVQLNIQRPGTRFQGILKAGESVTPGTALISDGTGCLIALASAASGTTVQKVMAYAEETLDLTVSGAVDTLVCARAA